MATLLRGVRRGGRWIALAVVFVLWFLLAADGIEFDPALLLFLLLIYSRSAYYGLTAAGLRLRRGLRRLAANNISVSSTAEIPPITRASDS